MVTVNRFEDWARRAVDHQSERQTLAKRARTAEIISATGAALFAFVAIWGFAASEAVSPVIPPTAIGSIGLLGFTIFMIVAAAAALQQRILAVVHQLEARATARAAAASGGPSRSAS